MFSRGEGEQKITVALNAGNHTKELIFSGEAVDLYTNNKAQKFELKPNGFLIISAKKAN